MHCALQILAAWKVISSESSAPITTLILLEGGRRPETKNKTALDEEWSGNWVTTFWSNQATNSSGNPFQSRRLFTLDKFHNLTGSIILLGVMVQLSFLCMQVTELPASEWLFLSVVFYLGWG